MPRVPPQTTNFAGRLRSPRDQLKQAGDFVVFMDVALIKERGHELVISFLKSRPFFDVLDDRPILQVIVRWGIFNCPGRDTKRGEWKSSSVGGDCSVRQRRFPKSRFVPTARNCVDWSISSGIEFPQRRSRRPIGRGLDVHSIDSGHGETGSYKIDLEI